MCGDRQGEASKSSMKAAVAEAGCGCKIAWMYSAYGDREL